MRKRLLLIFAALLLALTASGLVFLQQRRFSETIREMEGRFVSVPVAQRDVPQFSLIASADVKTIRMPAQSVPAKEVTPVSEIVGRPALVPLTAGDMIFRSKVAANPERFGVAYRLGKGVLAIAVPIDEVVASGGLLRPGDYVDLFHVVATAKEPIPIARLLLSRLKVLSIGGALTRSEERTDKAKVNVARTAVLEVNPLQAAIAAWAQSQGNFRLALRPAGDESETPVVEYRGPENMRPAQVSPVPAERPRTIAKTGRATGKGWAIQILSPGASTTVLVPREGGRKP